jgi:hypothetical protein
VGTLVDLWIRAPDKVKDVHGQRAVPRSNLVDDEVFVREVFKEILRYQALSDGLPIGRLCARINNMDRRPVGRSTYLEQFCGCMPNLSAWSLVVCTICRIPPRDLILKLYRVAHGAEVDRVARRCEDGCLLWKIPIVGVVQRILDKIAHEHLDACWWFRVPLEVIRRDARICRVLRIRCLIEEYLRVVVETVPWRFPSSGRERSGCEGSCEPAERGSR